MRRPSQCVPRLITHWRIHKGAGTELHAERTARGDERDGEQFGAIERSQPSPFGHIEPVNCDSRGHERRALKRHAYWATSRRGRVNTRQQATCDR